jgi:hypothetical protein
VAPCKTSQSSSFGGLSKSGERGKNGCFYLIFERRGAHRAANHGHSTSGPKYHVKLQSAETLSFPPKTGAGGFMLDSKVKGGRGTALGSIRADSTLLRALKRPGSGGILRFHRPTYFTRLPTSIDQFFASLSCPCA